MKTLKFYQVCSGALALALAIGCSSEEREDNIGGISSEEAAELVAEALSADTGGIKNVLDELAEIGLTEAPAAKSEAFGSAADCGVQSSSSDAIDIVNGDRAITGSYIYQYTFSCDGLVPTSLEGSATATLNYTGPNFNSSATYTAGAVLTNLSGSEPFGLTGEVNYSSTQELNDENRTFLLEWVLTSAQIEKINYDLIGGSGTIDVSGTGPNGAYEFSTTYTISGENEIVLTIGSTEFTIDLNSGIVTS